MISKPHLCVGPFKYKYELHDYFYLIIYLFLHSYFINLTGCGRVSTLQMSVSDYYIDSVCPLALTALAFDQDTFTKL